MKIVKLAVSLLLFAAASSTTFAQDNTINGKAVPEGQLTAVQDHCKELQTQQGLTGSQQPETSMDPTTKAKTSQVGDQDNPGTLDVATITLEQCVDGGFIKSGSAQ